MTSESFNDEDKSRLESTQRMNDFLDLMERFDQLSNRDLRDIVTTGVWNQERQADLFHILDRADASKVPAWRVHANFQTELRMGVTASFHIADKTGGVTGLGSLVFKRNNGLSYWDEHNPTILVRNYGEGQFGRISGIPGKGKTNTGCVIIQELLAAGFHVISNIKLIGEVAGYHYAKDIVDLFRAISELPDGVCWVFILDEGGLVYSKADASTTRAKELNRLANVIRKLHGNFIVIDQRPESIPTIIQEYAFNLYYAHEVGRVTVDLRGPVRKTCFTVRDFPKATLPFDTYDIAYFQVDARLTDRRKKIISELLERVTGAVDVKGTMKAFVDEL